MELGFPPRCVCAEPQTSVSESLLGHLFEGGDRDLNVLGGHRVLRASYCFLRFLGQVSQGEEWGGRRVLLTLALQVTVFPISW